MAQSEIVIGKNYAIMRYAKIRSWATLGLINGHNNREGEVSENVDERAHPPIELLGDAGSNDFVASARARLVELNISMSEAREKILAVIKRLYREAHEIKERLLDRETELESGLKLLPKMKEDIIVEANAEANRILTDAEHQARGIDETAHAKAKATTDAAGVERERASEANQIEMDRIVSEKRAEAARVADDIIGRAQDDAARVIDEATAAARSEREFQQEKIARAEQELEDRRRKVAEAEAAVVKAAVDQSLEAERLTAAERDRTLEQAQIRLVSRAAEELKLAIRLDDSDRGITMDEAEMSESERGAYRARWGEIARAFGRMIATTLARLKAATDKAFNDTKAAAAMKIESLRLVAKIRADQETLQTDQRRLRDDQTRGIVQAEMHEAKRVRLHQMRVTLDADRARIEPVLVAANAFRASWAAIKEADRTPPVGETIAKGSWLDKLAQEGGFAPTPKSRGASDKQHPAQKPPEGHGR